MFDIIKTNLKIVQLIIIFFVQSKLGLLYLELLQEFRFLVQKKKTAKDKSFHG